MAYIASTFTVGTGQKGCFSGIIAWINEDWSKSRRIHLPPHCAAVENHPSGENYLSRQYLVGGHSRNIVIDEMFRASVQGILPPPAPTVTSGAGTVAQIGYLRFYDEITGERSSLSSGSTTFTGDVNRVWTALPTVVPGEIIVIDGTADIAAGVVTGSATNFHELRPSDRIANAAVLTRWAQVHVVASSVSMTIDDTAMAGSGITLAVKPVSRVSHVELWVSIGGALPRFIMRVRIGTTTVTENVATLALGEALIDSYEMMPKGTYNVIYNSRQIVSGVVGQRDRIFVSPIGYPERYGGLNFQTKYGEPVVGLIRTRDYVIILCQKSSYRLQGYLEDDFALTILDPEIGGLGHGGNAVCGGRVFIPSREQIQTFDGSFTPANPSRQSEWAKNVRDFDDAYQSGVAIVDPEGQNYRFMPFPLRLSIGADIPPLTPLCTDTDTGGTGLGGAEEIFSDRLYTPFQDAGYGDVSYLYFLNSQDPMLRKVAYTPITDVDLVIFPSDVDSLAFVAGQDTDNILFKGFARRESPVLMASVAKTVLGSLPVAGIVYEGDPYIFVGDSGEKLWVAPPDHAIPTMKIYKYTGGALVEEAVNPDPDSERALCASGGFAVLGSDLYFVTNIVDNDDSATIGAYPPKIFRKSGGVWSSFAIPVTLLGPGQRADVYGIAAFDGAIYIAASAIGYVGDSWGFYKVVGSTVTVEHEFVVGVAFPTLVHGPFVFNGYLYYIWQDVSNDHHMLGRFDGITWDDAHKDIEDIFITGGEFFLFCGVLEGALHLVLANDPEMSGPCETINTYAFSPGTDTAGSWTVRQARTYNELAVTEPYSLRFKGSFGTVF